MAGGIGIDNVIRPSNLNGLQPVVVRKNRIESERCGFDDMGCGNESLTTIGAGLIR